MATIYCYSLTLLSSQIKDQSFQSLASQSSSTTEAKESVASRQSMGEGTSMESKPQTAHAVLSEGSISCLALSRRGLFTAGKVGSFSKPLDRKLKR